MPPKADTPTSLDVPYSPLLTNYLWVNKSKFRLQSIVIVIVFYSAHARVKMVVKTPLRGMVRARVNASVMDRKIQLSGLKAASVRTSKLLL